MIDRAALIDAAVSVDTFAPQLFWLLIVALPRAKVTERVMGGIGPLLGLSLFHLAVVVTAVSLTVGRVRWVQRVVRSWQAG